MVLLIIQCNTSRDDDDDDNDDEEEEAEEAWMSYFCAETKLIRNALMQRKQVKPKSVLSLFYTLDVE